MSDRLYQRRYFPAGGLPVRGFSLTVPGRRSNVKHLCLDNRQKPSKAFLTSEITIKQANKIKSRKLHAFESIMMPFSCSFRTINLRSSHLVRHLEVSGINMRTLHDGKFLLLFPRRPSESGAPERGTPDFKWRGWSRDFWGFEIFDSRILLRRKNWQVYFFLFKTNTGKSKLNTTTKLIITCIALSFLKQYFGWPYQPPSGLQITTY